MASVRWTRCSSASSRRSRRRRRSADFRNVSCEKNAPACRGVLVCVACVRRSVGGQDAQVVGLQDRIDGGEEGGRLAGLAAATVAAAGAATGLAPAVDRSRAERRVLVALATAAAARKHALCLSRAGDVGTAGITTLGACG